MGDHRLRINDKWFRNEDGETISVKTCFLDSEDEALPDPLTSIIFIDAQGSEGAIFEGASSYMKAATPMIFEFWPYGLMRLNGLDSLYHSLEKSNYTKMVNIRRSSNVEDFCIDKLKKIESDLGSSGRFTDILVF